jgi:pyruvate dehydrogenase E1 component beta subunit
MNRTGRDSLRAALQRHLQAGGALVGEAVGAHGVTEGFAPGPNLVRTPLSEGASIGVAAGLALSGRKVVVELVDPAGLARAGDVLGDIATLRARSNGVWAAPIVVRAPFAAGLVTGGLFAGGLPAGVTVAVAATADDLVGMFGAALASADPVVLLESAAALDDRTTGAAAAPLGALVTRRDGAAVTVFALGDAVATALIAADGTDAEVVDLRGLAPLDRAGIGARVRRTGRAVVVGAPACLAIALQEAFLHLESPLLSLPADATAEAIAAAIRDSVTY